MRGEGVPRGLVRGEDAPREDGEGVPREDGESVPREESLATAGLRRRVVVFSSAVCLHLLKEHHVGPLNTILLVAWAISAVALIILVLMHSGKGTGVSDMIASSMYNANAGSGVWEKNLDRLTVIAAVVFFATIVIFMLTYPLGTIGA